MLLDNDLVWTTIIDNEELFKLTIRRWIKIKELVEECFEDITYDAVCHAVDTYDESRNVLFKTWVFSTYRYRILQWISARSKYQGRFVEFSAIRKEMELDKLTECSSSNLLICTIEDVDDLYTLIRLAKLTEWEDLVIKQRHFYDMAFADIGEPFNLHESTVRKSYNIAMDKLREAARLSK